MIDRRNDDRIAELNAWLAKNRVSKRDLAVKLGVHPSMVSRIITGERAPARLLDQLAALGIPREHLPPPNGRPGRPPRSLSHKEGQE